MSHLAPVWFQVTDLQVASGEGSRITTVDGEVYLDFTAGIAVVSTGHCHPHVVEAIREQAGRFIHAQVNCYRHDLLEPLAERLAGISPEGIDTFFYANSGAEATEGAVKLAKQATGRPERDRVPGQLPRPHPPGDGHDDLQDRVPRRPLAPACGCVPRAVPDLDRHGPIRGAGDRRGARRASAWCSPATPRRPRPRR